MSDATWIDGFNLFHLWEETAELFRDKRGPDFEIGHAIDQSLRLLSGLLGKKRARVIVFLDGGLEKGGGTLYGIRVRYAGSGRKADSDMSEAMRGLLGKTRGIVAVTDDRALAASLRSAGAKICGVGDYIGQLTRPRRGGKGEEKTSRYKTREIPGDEVREWLKLFEDDRDE